MKRGIFFKIIISCASGVALSAPIVVNATVDNFKRNENETIPNVQKTNLWELWEPAETTQPTDVVNLNVNYPNPPSDATVLQAIKNNNPSFKGTEDRTAAYAISTTISGTTYTARVTVTNKSLYYVLNSYQIFSFTVSDTKIDLKNVFTQNVTSDIDYKDLVNWENDDTIGDKVIAIIRNQYINVPDISWNQLKINYVDFNSPNVIASKEGLIKIIPKSNSTSYTGDVTIKFPESFPVKVQSYKSTGSQQTFTAPNAGDYTITCYGATSRGSSEYNGNLLYPGGYTTGTIHLDANQTLYVQVGNQSGYNGGGRAVNLDRGRGSGGADVRLVPNDNVTYPDGWSDPISLNSRIMVAGGAGGSAPYHPVGVNQNGGFGGGINGVDSYRTSRPPYLYEGWGGKQTSGGGYEYRDKMYWEDTNGTQTFSYFYGMFGKGASTDGIKIYLDADHLASTQGSNYCGQGGGGWYGGNPGGRFWGWDAHPTGGGGSSFISGLTGCVALADPASDISEPRIAKTTGNISVQHILGQDWIFQDSLTRTQKENEKELTVSDGLVTISWTGI